MLIGRPLLQVFGFPDKWIRTEQDYEYLEEVTGRIPREISILKRCWSESNDIKNWVLHKRNMLVDEAVKLIDKPEYKKSFQENMKFLDEHFFPAYTREYGSYFREIGKQEQNTQQSEGESKMVVASVVVVTADVVTVVEADDTTAKLL